MSYAASAFFGQCNHHRTSSAFLANALKVSFCGLAAGGGVSSSGASWTKEKLPLLKHHNTFMTFASAGSESSILNFVFLRL